MIKVQTIDLHFQGVQQVIASYLLETEEGLVLIETGPGSVIEHAKQGLQNLGYRIDEVKHVLLTHIHLDHAGAAGWWAQQGAHIYVHHIGAKHLIDPSRLLASATRIYGDEMDRLWGKMYPVPEKQLTALEDNDVLKIGALSVNCLDTPGHAFHHMTYHIDDVAFTGDVGGATVPTYGLVDAATPPPEFNLELWLASIDRLLALDLRRIYVAHFGEVREVKHHLTELKKLLMEAAEFVSIRLQEGQAHEEITNQYYDWYRSRSLASGVPEEVFNTLAMSNSPSMTTSGIMRYWRKRWENEAR